jgi:hypothetical protein
LQKEFTGGHHRQGMSGCRFDSHAVAGLELCAPNAPLVGDRPFGVGKLES